MFTKIIYAVISNVNQKIFERKSEKTICVEKK